jgi:WD40 repeat protein
LLPFRIFDKPFSHKKPILKSHFYHNSDVMVARYDYQDTIIAVGSADGVIRLYNVNTLNLLLEVSTNSGNDKYPATALRWKPANSEGDSGSSSILATNASGRIVEFSTKTGKIVY